jgi:hypothetical protein
MNLADKLLWDKPLQERKRLTEKLGKSPAQTLEDNDALFVKALNTLSWYELIDIFGAAKLSELLTDDIIDKLFPTGRREYYKNARRLLSSYALSPAG